MAFHNALELARRGHRVVVYTAAISTAGYQDPPEIEVRRLPALFRFGNAPFTPELLVSLHQFDIVHLHWPYIFGAELTGLATLLAGVPYVVTYHMDLRADLRWLFGPYQALVGPIIIRNAAALLPVSLDYFRASSLYRCAVGFGTRVVEIPNGVDTTQFRPDIEGTAVRRRLAIPDTAILVGYVGMMDRPHAGRGVPVLLEALAAMADRSVHFMGVGGGELQPEYRRRAGELGLAERSHWTGTLPAVGAQLPSHIAAMDVLVLPSLRAESFGMVLIEAMAAGKPVIGTDLPGARRVVDDDLDGFLVPPGDAAALAARLDLLVSDPDLRLRMGTQGRTKVVARYDWRSIAARLEQEYLFVLSARAGRGRKRTRT